MDTAAAEHEAVHAHAQVLALSLETFPDKHTGALHPRHLAGAGSDLVTTFCSGLSWKKEQALLGIEVAGGGGVEGAQEKEKGEEGQ